MRQLDKDLEDLKSLILTMGKNIEDALTEAVESITRHEPEHFNRVMALEKQTNQLHLQIDNTCLNLLATQAPVAHQLRFVVAIIKINSDLERMGDQAVNIALNARHARSETATPATQHDIATMARETQNMVHEALRAFLDQSVALAYQVLERDSILDALKDKVLCDLIPHMEKSPSDVKGSLELILITRNLERIGDHATNIAEDVIFACTGEDIRHVQRQPQV